MTAERDPLLIVLEVVGERLRDQATSLRMHEADAANFWERNRLVQQQLERTLKALTELVAEVDTHDISDQRFTLLRGKVSAAKQVLR